ncbi:OprO/OprP family phosphate-selective porin [Pelagerythrobacter marinus]|uniref:OprO/OprP family phosphate-selective porin n=1 Tax=Pelagerythrobacter marinus TaxID=538382 RepID=UPI002036F6BB|nr:porin [Pelagerythrobacter marinus]USA39349.1 OprO/OprP family phosphate-selective porin [Pelagerythrobacter marinus]WPZ06510.1 porin [Pelagerythrobacter marinus]
MKNILFAPGLVLAAMPLAAAPAIAQETPPAASETARELAAMRAEMARMAARIETLEAELAAADDAPAAVPADDVTAAVPADDATAAADPANAHAEGASGGAPAGRGGTTIRWKGAPVIEGEGGWSFKPRGRLQIDAGTIAAPAATGVEDGFGSEIRRARLGVEGDIPGGFGYKFELDFAGGEVEIADAIATYGDGGLTVSAGQHNTFQGLEELTSSRFISTMERAAFTDAFGFERRVGLSAQYAADGWLVQAGVFGDNADDLSNRNWSVDGRLVAMPELGGAQLHLGGSLHYAEYESGTTLRYRQRPFVHFTDTRFIDTGRFAADSELGMGLEAAAIAGPFHAAAEGFWQKVDRPGALADPTFFGGYAEVGLFLTRGDTRGYKRGVFDRVKPASPVGEGGFGAIQVNLRYDRLDLSEAAIVGGTQDGYALSLVWTPTDHTRLMANYGRMEYRGAAIPAAGGERSYGVDAFGVRAQIDF